MKFAKAVAERLRDASIEDGSNGSISSIQITGVLHTRVKLARVQVDVPSRFKDLRRCPPQVTCGEDWVKIGEDWHNGPPLCWVLQDEWRDAMDWKGKPATAIIAEGTTWLFDEVRYLLNKHFVAHIEGLDSWPPEWPYWSHGPEGSKEYRRTKKRG